VIALCVYASNELPTDNVLPLCACDYYYACIYLYSGMDVAVAVKMSKLEKARLPSGTIRLSGLRLKARLLLSIEVCLLLYHI
jgi:hypothetical protein